MIAAIALQQQIHKQCFDEPFWSDKYEVTQRQFAQFGGQAENASYFAGDNRPRENITWPEARAFCERRQARLPTEAEWEYAARGLESPTYPWSNEFVVANVVYSDNSNSQTAAVGSRPGGVSWVGAYDMSGNVWEWVSTWYASYPYDGRDGREDKNSSSLGQHVLRAGSWQLFTLNTRAAHRFEVDPLFWNNSVGLRCVRS